MATTKKPTAAKAVEKKVEVTPAAKTVETKATEKKVETKTAAKAETKKAETKKAETKTAAKKTTTKKAAKKENNVFVQFAGMEFNTADVEKAVKDDYKAQSGKKTMTSVSIYIKPEDGKAYYVIDGITGSVSL